MRFSLVASEGWGADEGYRLTQAMRLASFYTPLAVKRVHELVAGRRPIPSPFLGARRFLSSRVPR